MNYNIKLDLSKVTGTFVTDLKGRTTTKRCLCIPIEDAGLFVGQKGIYLDAVAVEMREAKYEDTHFIRSSVPSAQYKAMTDEQRKAIPIIGTLKPVNPSQTNLNQLGDKVQDFVAEWGDGAPY